MNKETWQAEVLILALSVYDAEPASSLFGLAHYLLNLGERKDLYATLDLVD